MRYRALVEAHKKNCWLVEMVADGTIFATSFYKRGFNWEHKVPKGTAPSEKLPKYVQQMVMEMRLAHPEVG